MYFAQLNFSNIDRLQPFTVALLLKIGQVFKVQSITPTHSTYWLFSTTIVSSLLLHLLI